MNKSNIGCKSKTLVDIQWGNARTGLGVNQFEQICIMEGDDGDVFFIIRK